MNIGTDRLLLPPRAPRPPRLPMVKTSPPLGELRVLGGDFFWYFHWRPRLPCTYIRLSKLRMAL